MRRVTTKTKMANAESPLFFVNWIEDRDFLGWRGVASVLTRPHKESELHTVSVRQTIPLGLIVVTVDECAGGCWATAKFEGVGLTERDLQWAALYAMEAIKRKEEAA